MKVYIIEEKRNVRVPRELKIERDSGGFVTVTLPSKRRARLDRGELLVRGSTYHKPSDRLFYTWPGLLLLKELQDDIARSRASRTKMLAEARA